MSKRKLVIIPTILVSSALLFTACGNDSEPKNESPSSSSTVSSAPEYVAPPSNLEEQYKQYVSPITITDEAAWSMYKDLGATTYEEDPSKRSTTPEDWKAAQEASREMNDVQKMNDFNLMFGEVKADIDQSALNISAFLAQNPEATLDDVKAQEGLLVSRHEKLGTLKVEQDSSTGFFFVILISEDEQIQLGQMVPQKGITPDFAATNQPATPSEEPAPSEGGGEIVEETIIEETIIETPIESP